MIGGVFVYLSGKRILSPDGALFASALFLFIPYGIAASRSFQPDPLTVALISSSIYIILRHDSAPTRRNLVFMITLSALAIFVKLTAIFFVFSVFIGFALRRHGLLRGIISRESIIFAIGALFPSFIFYFLGIYVLKFLENQTGGRFVPALWLTLGYWANWIAQVGVVIGFVPLIIAIQGVLTAQRGEQRTLLISLWVGYLIYGLIFTYHISSHDYYSLPFIPVAAFSIAGVADFLFLKRRFAFIFSPLLLIVTMVIGSAVFLQSLEYAGDPISLEQTAAEIGEDVHHSDKTIFYADDYASIIRYYGDTAGIVWPMTNDIAAAKLAGEPDMTAEKRFQTMTANQSFDYFVLTQSAKFGAQPDLVRFLQIHFPVLKQTSDYAVFDLQHPLTKAS
jgi:uncharacterized membrane protein